MSGQTWVENGGYMSSKNLSKKLRYYLQPLVKWRQFCDAKDASQQGKKKGDVYHWDIYSDAATQGTTLTETNTMPETQFTVTQGTLTITEAGNSFPFSDKLDNLSEHPVKEIINEVIKHDAKKAFDILSHAQFDDTVLRVAPTGGTSTTAVTITENGVCSTTNNVALGKAHIGLIVDAMKERNIIPYVNDDYYALAWPSTFRSLKNDLEGVHQYTTEGFQLIMNGEAGRYNNCRFVEQTHIQKGGAADSTTWTAGTADAWDNAKSDWVFFFGQSTVAEAIAVPEEMRGKIPTDYGRSKGIAWYYLGGFGLIHTAASQARIIKWDSAS